MTTRDPRSRAPARPDAGREGARDPTQPLSIEIDPADRAEDPSHPSLAVGTSDASREERTKVESPNAKSHPRPPSNRPPPTPDRNSDDPEHRLGSVLGTYRITELLGKGGMGYVYRAEHVKLGREVALKLLRSDYARRRDAVLRFFQEAKTVNRVRHRNIVDVTDFVELPDGPTFIIMELLSGTSLGKWARTGVDLPRALAVLVQICDGLGAAHAVGVVHRDLKPDNVIVVPTSDGAELVKLLDFGVAKLVNRDDEDVGFQTQAGSVIGTPAYMSPEQAGGMAVDHRSDIYSLGAIMYELFCGQPMFRGRSFGEYVRKHLTEMPVPPSQTQAGQTMDPRLEALILKCLAKDPNERFNHILELRDGLMHMLGGAYETHPPGYSSAVSSVVSSSVSSAARPMPTTQLPPHMLPLAPGMATTVPTPANPSYMTQSSQVYGQYGYTPAPPPAASSPWWAWLVGGAFAIGIGIAGAVWYANRTSASAVTDDKPAAVAAAAQPPTATAIEPASPPTPPQQTELRFDSLPSGGVYADGHSAELCRTPCAFDVDLKDGGPTDHRTFVVRSEGYRDKQIVVDLTAARRDFHLTLERLEPATPEPVEDRPTPKHPGAKTSKTSKKPVIDKKPVDTVKEPTELPDLDTKPNVPVKRPDEKIDPADTHDPFHRQRR